jgi:hypothetical protein
MEYDHQCVCGHREKNHAPASGDNPESKEQNRLCNVCDDCMGFKATNIVSNEKSEA